jgi:hypothetical protein
MDYETPQVLATYAEDELTADAAVCCVYSNTPID